MQDYPHDVSHVPIDYEDQDVVKVTLQTSVSLHCHHGLISAR